MPEPPMTSSINMRASPEPNYDHLCASPEPESDNEQVLVPRTRRPRSPIIIDLTNESDDEPEHQRPRLTNMEERRIVLDLFFQSIADDSE